MASSLNLHIHQWMRIPRWLLEPKAFWAFLVGLFLACLLGDWFGALLASGATRQDKIRYAGWILDTLGLVSIAVGISSKLDRFQGKSLLEFAWEHTSQWLKKFPLIRQHTKIVAGSGNLTLSAPRVSAYGSVKANPDWTTERKTEWLLERYYDLVENFHQMQQSLEEKESELSSRISELEKEITDRVDSLRAENTEIHVGDVGKEFVGLFWIFAGITFATVPESVEATFWWVIAPFQSVGLFIFGETA